jgi:hypothetical protein
VASLPKSGDLGGKCAAFMPPLTASPPEWPMSFAGPAIVTHRVVGAGPPGSGTLSARPSALSSAHVLLQARVCASCRVLLGHAKCRGRRDPARPCSLPHRSELMSIRS